MPAEVEIDTEESATTRPSDLGFPKAAPTNPQGIPVHREIEVQAIDPKPAAVDASGYVEIRMAETIDEFTYGNPHHSYKLEANKRYRLPVDVARYLYNLGYTYQIATR